jgi:class 3 adenylate cyclase
VNQYPPTGAMAMYEQMSLADLIRLRDDLAQILRRRFGRTLALVFTDVEGSTAYFARFGDEAGRALQQRHIEMLHALAVRVGGRIVDTAGDGAFAIFPTVDTACATLREMQQQISVHNLSRPAEHHLKVRCGIHWGSVLTDGVIVTGDAVNFSARVTGTGQGGEIRLSREAFGELGSADRTRCTPLSPVTMKGFADPVPLVLFAWQDRSIFPTTVSVDESGEVIQLPQQRDTLTFGRLKGEEAGMGTNDIVLSVPDPDATLKISRWHFELRKSPQGYVLRPVSSALTEVDGRIVTKGGEALLTVGSVVRVAGVMTLRFRGEAGGPPNSSSAATVYR